MLVYRSATSSQLRNSLWKKPRLGFSLLGRHDFVAESQKDATTKCLFFGTGPTHPTNLYKYIYIYIFKFIINWILRFWKLEGIPSGPLESENGSKGLKHARIWTAWWRHVSSKICIGNLHTIPHHLNRSEKHHEHHTSAHLHAWTLVLMDTRPVHGKWQWWCPMLWWQNQ